MFNILTRKLRQVIKELIYVNNYISKKTRGTGKFSQVQFYSFVTT